MVPRARRRAWRSAADARRGDGAPGPDQGRGACHRPGPADDHATRRGRRDRLLRAHRGPLQPRRAGDRLRAAATVPWPWLRHGSRPCAGGRGRRHRPKAALVHGRGLEHAVVAGPGEGRLQAPSRDHERGAARWSTSSATCRSARYTAWHITNSLAFGVGWKSRPVVGGARRQPCGRQPTTRTPCRSAAAVDPLAGSRRSQSGREKAGRARLRAPLERRESRRGSGPSQRAGTATASASSRVQAPLRSGPERPSGGRVTTAPRVDRSGSIRVTRLGKRFRAPADANGSGHRRHDPARAGRRDVRGRRPRDRGHRGPQRLRQEHPPAADRRPAHAR